MHFLSTNQALSERTGRPLRGCSQPAAGSPKVSSGCRDKAGATHGHPLETLKRQKNNGLEERALRREKRVSARHQVDTLTSGQFDLLAS
jgi:hypothetical protein